MTQSRPPSTCDDYRMLPEDMARRVELMEGALLMMPSPGMRHQRVSRQLFTAINLHAIDHALGEVFYPPVAVKLGEGDAREVVHPDIVFVANERSYTIKRDSIEGPPDLMIEILSLDTLDRDRGAKLRLCARHGVREYWIVDPDHDEVEVHGLHGDNFELAARYTATDNLRSRVLPGMIIPLGAVFMD